MAPRLNDHLILCVALRLLLNLCIIDTTIGGVVQLHDCSALPGAYHHHTKRPWSVMSSTVRDHCWFESLPHFAWTGCFSRRICCCIFLGGAAFFSVACCYIHSRCTMTPRCIPSRMLLCYSRPRCASLGTTSSLRWFFSATIPRHDPCHPQHSQPPPQTPSPAFGIIICTMNHRNTSQ